MADAILVYGKAIEEKIPMIPVKINFQNSNGDHLQIENKVFDNRGILSRFTVANKEYKFRNSDLRRTDRRKSNGGGYYEETSFKNYMIGQLSFDHLIRWDEFSLADNNDLVKVEKLEPVSPYIGFYYNKLYTFNVEIEQGDTTPKSYFTSEEFPDDSPTITYTGYINVDDENDIVPLIPIGSFYKENFSDYVVNWTDNDALEDEKKELAFKMTIICWKIHYIHKDILFKLAISDNSTIQNAAIDNFIVYANNQNDPNNTYNDLELIDKLIVNLFKDWGYLLGQGVAASKILPSTPEKKELDNYYNLLSNFYRSLNNYEEEELFPTNQNGDPINNDGEILTTYEDSERRIKKLYASLFNDLTLLSIEGRLTMLNNFINREEIYEEEEITIDESDILYLLASIGSYNEANDILDLLLETITDNTNGKIKTKFEKLYYLMDDQRLDRIFIVQWFVDEDNNRQNLINSLYRIWKISKYNLFYVPNNVTPNEDGLNPNCFFLDETQNGGAKYYAQYDNEGNLLSGAEPILEWETSDFKIVENSYTFYQVSDTKISYKPESDLKREIVTINRISTASYINNFSQFGLPTKTSIKSFYGNYHIYQPICLLGYQADLELSIPNMEPIPAFLFFYAEEFDRLKDIDAAISFAVEVGVEIGLFFLTGGWTTIGHLKHLRHVTKLKHLKVVGNSLQLVNIAAEDAVLVWRGIEAGAEATSVTAGIMSSLFNYQYTTENDPQLAELNKKISNFFLVLTFTTAGKAILSRYKAVKSANEVITELDVLTSNGIVHNLPSDVENVIYTIGNKITLKLSQNINSLASEFPQLANKLLDIKNNTNLKLASQLSEIIINRSNKTKLKFNDNPNFLDQFNNLPSVKAFKNISEYFDEFYEISGLQNVQKNAIIDPPNGSTVTRTPVFSEKTYSGVGNQQFLVSDIPRHTLQEIDDMISFGFNEGLELEEIYGFIIKSYRCRKQVPSNEVLDWLTNYKNFLTNGEIPYPFTTVSHFDVFRVEVGNLFSKYKIGNKITIGGSSLSKLIPPDLDLVVYLDPNKYDDLIKHYENVLNRLKSYSKANNGSYLGEIRNIEKAIQKSKNSGKIDVKCMIHFEIINGQPTLNRFLSELKSSSFTTNLNIGNNLTNGIDFNIYRSKNGNRAISLPPEMDINL